MAKENPMEVDPCHVDSIFPISRVGALSSLEDACKAAYVQFGIRAPFECS